VRSVLAATDALRADSVVLAGNTLESNQLSGALLGARRTALDAGSRVSGCKPGDRPGLVVIGKTVIDKMLRAVQRLDDWLRESWGAGVDLRDRPAGAGDAALSPAAHSSNRRIVGSHGAPPSPRFPRLLKRQAAPGTRIR
jgi:hypothetical protein